MLAGRRPFGDTVASLLTEAPPPIGSARKTFRPPSKPSSPRAWTRRRRPTRRPRCRRPAESDQRPTDCGSPRRPRFAPAAVLRRSVGSRDGHGPFPWVVVVGSQRARPLGANGGHSENPRVKRDGLHVRRGHAGDRSPNRLPDDAQLRVCGTTSRSPSRSRPIHLAQRSPLGVRRTMRRVSGGSIAAEGRARSGSHAPVPDRESRV